MGGTYSRLGRHLVIPLALVVALGPITPASSQPDPSTLSPASSGVDCEWGTEPAQVIPAVDYPHGYLRGDDWWREHASPVECAIGPAWTPLVQHFPYSKIIAMSAQGGREVSMALCASLTDPHCSPDDWAQVISQSVADVCVHPSDFNCIESLEAIDASGNSRPARYVRAFPQAPAVPESLPPDAFMPAGGSVPLWEYDTEAGTATLLSLGATDLTFRPSGGRWVGQPDGQFSLALVPVDLETRIGLPRPSMEEKVDPSTGLPGINRQGWGHVLSQGCAAFDQDTCAIDASFPPGYRFRISLRLRDTSGLYLNGAVDAPVAYSEKVEGGHRFVIEAGASPVLGVAGWIPKNQVPRSLIDEATAQLGWQNWDIDFDAASYRSLGRGSDAALTWFKALLPFFGNRTSFVVDAWYVENTPSLGRYTSKCVNRGHGEFIGIVSSNATAYTGNPPTYDAATNTLSYEVAAPHYLPDGKTLSRGRYSINMNAEFVKCILGVDKVPSQARVELIYPDGEASAATLALTQDRNWLKLYYENFTFSNPTVSVQFPRSLTCVKGKGKKAKVKKVVAFTCPKGWKQRG